MNDDHIPSNGSAQHSAPDSPSIRLEDLPPPGTTRWVVRRKAAVVAGVRAGLLTLDEACDRYRLSVEEFLSWQNTIDRHGERGLRVTRLKDYRETQLTPTDQG